MTQQVTKSQDVKNICNQNGCRASPPNMACSQRHGDRSGVTVSLWPLLRLARRSGPSGRHRILSPLPPREPAYSGLKRMVENHSR
eukprot:1578994-Amphidinium_carterae.1